MNRTIYQVLAACFAAAAPLTAGSMAAARGNAPAMPKMENVGVSHAGSMLRVSFDIDTHAVRPGSERQVTLTPVVRSLDPESSDSVVLEPLVIAGRNRYMAHLRKGDVRPGTLLYRAGGRETAAYSAEVAWQPWMQDSEVVVRAVTQDCCRPVRPLRDTPVATFSPVEICVTDAFEATDYMELTGDAAVELEEQGTAYVDFPVNVTVIMDRYRNNPAELRKITGSIDRVRNDPDATITKLSIRGFASPEGPYANNVRLAMGRTEALKEYVRGMYDFDPEIMTTGYEPEDWAGLRTWLEECGLPGRDGMLAVVDSELGPDAKDEALRTQFPRQYAVLLDSVYPALRRSDYAIRYTVRTYTGIDELMEVYRTSPERLRPVDFQRVAEEYPEGSPEFEEVQLKASDVYPHDPAAAVNAANILMRRGDTEGAARKASLAGESGEAYYTRGMLAVVNGDFGRARTLLAKAAELGVEKGALMLGSLPEDGASETVTYLTGDTGEGISDEE